MPDARILIVEDEAISAMDIQQRLVGLGYPLPDVAYNGDEGVKKAQETQPDLVLMDIMMPGEIDGVVAAEQIRARFDIPIIFITAYADENTLRRAKITAPYGYIVKPFQERELRITIDMALYRHKMERELHEREKWLATTLRSIGDAVIATDANGLITFINPVAEGLTGFKHEEVRQRNLMEVFNIINRDTRKPVENPVTRVIREGHIAGLANHTVLISRVGREMPINDSAAPIKDDLGNIIGVILVFSDLTEREKSAESLRESQMENEFLAGLIRASSQPLAIGYPDGRLGLLNRAFEELTGYAADELRSINWATALTPPEWLEMEREKLAELHRTGQSVRYEKEYIKKDGTRVPVELLVHLVSDSEGKPQYYYAFLTDLTERKLAEEKVIKLNEELRKNVDELSVLNTSLRDSRRATLNIMEDALVARKRIEEANAELQIEVTDRKQAEESLQRSLGHFELLTVTAGELLHAADPQMVVESVCQKVMKYLDCHAFFNFLVDEKEGRLHLNACAGIPEEDVKKIEWLDYGAAICGCVARDGARIVAEHISNTADERTELLKFYGIQAFCCHPLLGPGGKVIGTLSFGTRGRESFSPEDLSLMKAVADQVAVAMMRMKGEQNILKLSEDMAVRNLELESVNKELESFIYSVSHDLRAPIRTMSGFAKILNEDYPGKLDAKGQDYLNRILNGSEKATQLINDLLHLSKISRQEPDRIEVNLSKKASKVVEQLREMDRGRNVEVVVQEGLTASVDPRLIEIALSNLLENAWKFTSKTEHARIEFGKLDCGLPPIGTFEGRLLADCGIKSETTNPKSEIEKTVYYVKDNGAGFDMTHADKMFWPFHRLHGEKEFEGTGIGLTIVERIIHRHGGKVWAEGEIGRGATVFFTL